MQGGKGNKIKSVDFYYWDKPASINEGISVSEGLQYHIDNKLPLGDCVFRYGSDKYIDLMKEVCDLYDNGQVQLNENDLSLVLEFNRESVIVENHGEVYLDFIYEDVSDLNEAEYKGKDVELNKPKRGGSKKFYVYVKDPKTKNVKKVSFGAKDGGGNLSVKLKDPKAKKAFADRHNCDQKNDKTKPGYWSCRLPRYAKLLGLSGGGTWW
jgi:hypothetical protein